MYWLVYLQLHVSMRCFCKNENKSKSKSHWTIFANTWHKLAGTEIPMYQVYIIFQDILQGCSQNCD